MDCKMIISFIQHEMVVMQTTSLKTFEYEYKIEYSV